MEKRFETFTLLVNKISRCIKKIKTAEVEELNLKGPHVSCIYSIYSLGNLTAKELCEICQEDKGAMSRTIEYLETNGYIECNSNLKKRYNSELTLTQKGKNAGKIIANKVDNFLEIASQGLTEENRQIMYDSLKIISENLENICKNYQGE